MQQTQTLELEDSGLQGLTSAQQVFVRLVFSGMQGADAYRQAYNMPASNPNAGTLAARLLNNARVNAKLIQLRLTAERETTLSGETAGISRQWVLQGFKSIAEDKTVKPSTRLQAYALAGKTFAAQVFKEPEKADSAPASPEDMDRRILELLRAGMATIDGVALDVTPAKEKAPAVKPGPAGVGRKRKPRA